MSSDKDNVRRIQELRRSSAASPVDRSMSRSQAKRIAIQDANEDGSCKGPCPYGTCGGGPSPCGGCCGCMGCEMANQPGPEHMCGACHKPVLYNQKFDQYACSDLDCVNAHGFGICGYYGCRGRFDDITDEHKAHHPTPEEIAAAPRRSARMDDDALERIRIEERDALDSMREDL